MRSLRCWRLCSRAVLVVSLVLALASCGSSKTEGGPLTFEGETVNIVVFTGPGAPPDIWFRTLGPYLQKNLPGNPKINYINKPGAGSMIAANYTAQALKPDGFSVGTMNAAAMDKAAQGISSARFDLREMRVIGALRKTRVIGVNLSEINTFEDLLTSDHQLILGTEADATPYYEAFSRLTGLNFRILSSYTNGVQTMQAFRTGEVDSMPISSIEWVTIKQSVEEEGGSALWQVGYLDGEGEVQSIDYVDVPTGHDIVRQLNPEAVDSDAWNTMSAAAAGQSISDEVWAPAGMPDEYVLVWREAFAKAVSDPEFVAKHVSSYGTAPAWTSGEDARTIVNEILAIYGR